MKEKKSQNFWHHKIGGKKKKKKEKPSLDVVVVVASAQAWDLAASSPGTPRADHKQQTRNETR